LAKPLHPVLGATALICFQMVKLLPVRTATEVMAFLGRRFAKFFTREKNIKKNLRIAFPDMDGPSFDTLMGDITANYGRLFAEIAHIPSFKSGRGGAVLRARGALEYPFEKRGKAIYVTAHLGNWELIPILFQQQNLPLAIIYSPIMFSVVDSKLMSMRRGTGATYLGKSNALRACITALKRNESIALLVDQRVDNGIEVDFFERQTLFTHLPARLALRFNCPIIPGESVRIGPGHFEVMFHEPIWPGNQRGEEAERDLTQRTAKAIEDCIRKYPEQWFCDKRRWEDDRKRSSV